MGDHLLVWSKSGYGLSHPLIFFWERILSDRVNGGDEIQSFELLECSYRFMTDYTPFVMHSVAVGCGVGRPTCH